MVPGWEARVAKELFPFQVKAAKAIADDVRNDIATHHMDTGDLFYSVRQFATRPTRVYIGTDHWWFIEFGTRPHLITVKQREVLTDRTDFYGTKVLHPGTRAYAPMRRALYTKRVLRG